MNYVIKQRALNRHDNKEYGDMQMFHSDITDYQEILINGCDSLVYGRFKEIEDLNNDAQSQEIMRPPEEKLNFLEQNFAGDELEKAEEEKHSE